MSAHPDSLTQLETAPPTPNWLPVRLRAWEAADIITHEQATAIRELEDTHAEPAETAFRYQRIIAVVSSFGGILLAAGLMLLVGSNWADLPRPAKVAIALGTVVGFETLGYWLRYHTDYRRIGGVFLFVGAAAYGAAIMLVAQAYNYPVDDPNLLLLWFAPVLPLAYLVRSPMIAALGLGVGYVALGYRAAEWFDRAPAGDDNFGWQLLYLAVGATVAAAGYLHHRFGETAKAMGRPYQWIGSLTVLVLLYVMSFEQWYDWGNAGSLDALPREVWFVLAAAVVVAVGSAMILLQRQTPDDRTAAAGVGVVAGAAFALTAILLAQPSGASFVPYLVINLLLIGTQIGLVVVGVITKQPALVNVSLAFFGLTVVSRYIEISAGMLATGLSMMIGGALILGLALSLERLRRNLNTRYELRGES